ncbi:MAG TPA: serine/threonine-protein kinase [Tepidisphaeraceae bacterium]|jgi:serine/threonine protein kinase|nr:serine/threonine-protein kinase [Tepidisphaeraceae bacterium]
MWTFQYKHGDRPLEGYTIQRAAGRGGFGEVYYAVSDSGREVALKVISGYEQIELRGISQCMNLKSPHLVTIFDVRQNAEGRWFVIMEFVSGANLRQLLDESPAGLGTQKAAFFLREIAKGLTFLHECGIVHRDLKPANIFYENGYVKIGDYGLSKAIAPDQHSGHTVTVGTVHYMAPEVGAGKYDRGVDIYALGALLYEMLTGTVPHVGASPTEVLMKHLSAEPDFTNIPEPFAKVIRKAMAKDPAQRYQNVQEMVEDVFGAEHIRQSVSVFSPQDLSMIAEHAAKRIGTGSSGGGVGVATGSSAATREPAGAKPDVWHRFANVFDKVIESSGWGTGDPNSPKDVEHEEVDAQGRRYRVVLKTGGAQAAPGTAPAMPNVDPLSAGQRRTLALMLSIAAAVVAGAIAGRPVDGEGAIFFVFPCVWGISLGSLIAARRVLPAMRHESMFVRRFITALFSGGLAFILTLPFYAVTGGYRYDNRYTLNELYLGALLAVLVAWIIVPVERVVASDRRHRINLGYAIAACVLGAVFGGMFSGKDDFVAVAATCSAAAMLMVQMLAAWHPREAIARKEAYESIKTATARHNWANEFRRVGHETREAFTQVGSELFGKNNVEPQQTNATQPASPPHDQALKNFGARSQPTKKSGTQYWWRPVPDSARWTWAAITVVCFALFVAMFVGAIVSDRYIAGPASVAAVALFQLAVFSLVRMVTKRFYGWWPYLLKPLLVFTCSTLCVFFIAIMCTVATSGGGLVAAWFFLALSFAAGIVVLCIPGRYRISSPPPIPGASSAPAAPEMTSAPGHWWQGGPGQLTRSERGHILLAMLAGMFIFLMLVVGLAYAVDVPSFISAGLLDPSLASQLHRDVFGNSDWGEPIERLVGAMTVAFMVLSMAFLTMARRNRGLLHMARGLLGLLGLISAIMMLRMAFRPGMWNQIAAEHLRLPGQILVMALDRMSAGPAIGAAVVFLIGVIFLVFPPAPRKGEGANAEAPQKSTGLRVLAAIVIGLFVVMGTLGMFIAIAVPTRSSSRTIQIVPQQGFPDASDFRYQLIVPPASTPHDPVIIKPKPAAQPPRPAKPAQPATAPSAFGGRGGGSAGSARGSGSTRPTTAPAPAPEPQGVFSD